MRKHFTSSLLSTKVDTWSRCISNKRSISSNTNSKIPTTNSMSTLTWSRIAPNKKKMPNLLGDSLEFSSMQELTQMQESTQGADLCQMLRQDLWSQVFHKRTTRNKIEYLIQASIMRSRRWPSSLVSNQSTSSLRLLALTNINLSKLSMWTNKCLKTPWKTLTLF